MQKIIHAAHAPAPIGPYSQAVKASSLLFVSGQIAIDQSTGTIITSSIEEETHQVMKNIGIILKEAGASYAQIVKTTIFLKNFNDFGKVNEIYGSYFKENFPARETVEVSRLPKDVNIEISVTVLMN